MKKADRDKLIKELRKIVSSYQPKVSYHKSDNRQVIAAIPTRGVVRWNGSTDSYVFGKANRCGFFYDNKGKKHRFMPLDFDHTWYSFPQYTHGKCYVPFEMLMYRKGSRKYNIVAEWLFSVEVDDKFMDINWKDDIERASIWFDHPFWNTYAKRTDLTSLPRIHMQQSNKPKNIQIVREK